MRANHGRRVAALVGAVAVASAAVLLYSRPAGSQAAASCNHGTNTSLVTSLPGYKIWLFTRASASKTSPALAPDSLVVDGSNVYVAWQNVTAKDGTDGKKSTVTQNDMCGTELKRWSVLGHNDGMRMDPTTHLLWAMSNEDGNPVLTTIDPATSATTQYKFGATPWGGGFDDIVFLKGKAYSDASNPTVDAAGNNHFPGLYQITLSGGKATYKPALPGYPKALGITPPQTVAPLNIIDPDSMTFTPSGDLMLDNQGGSQEIFIHDLGGPHQTLTSLNVGTQVDDTAFASSNSGCLLVAENRIGVYAICSTFFVPGQAFSATPNDSGVAGMVATLDMKTGRLSPIVVGLSDAHGMVFVPGMS